MYVVYVYNRVAYIFYYSVDMESVEKWFIKKKVDERGFGFISSEIRDKDIFFHANDMGKTPFEDITVWMPVTFELGKWTEEREKAINIELIEKEELKEKELA